LARDLLINKVFKVSSIVPNSIVHHVRERRVHAKQKQVLIIDIAMASVVYTLGSRLVILINKVFKVFSIDDH
jgi:hypothetical protein